MLEDHHRVGVGQGRGEHAARILDGRRRQHLDAGDVGVPAFEAVRMLGGELAAGAGRHADHQRHRELPARHVAVERRRIHDLVERQQAEIHRHHLDDGSQAAQGRADASTDETEFGQRRVADARRAELVKEAF